MFTYKNNIFLKKDKIYDFVNNYHQFGFVHDDNDYVLKKVLSETDMELYIQFTFSMDTLKIYIELNVPKSYWIEFGLNTFEPLLELYKQEYIEIK